MAAVPSTVDLPVMPPVKPMLAKAVPRCATRATGHYLSPSGTGFVASFSRDGDEVELGSRNDRPLTATSPEVVALLRVPLPGALCGRWQIVVVPGSGLAFETLQQRLAPDQSRVGTRRRLASFVAFDLLALGDSRSAGRAVPRRSAARASRRTCSAAAYLGPVPRDAPTTDGPDVAED